jgi:hypothetical protein
MQSNLTVALSSFVFVSYLLRTPARFHLMEDSLLNVHPIVTEQLPWRNTSSTFYHNNANNNRSA